MVKHGLTRRLRAFRNAESGDNDMEMLQQRWVHIAVDYLLYPIEKHVKWISHPISYIVQYYRIREVSNLVNRLIRWNASNQFVYKPLMDLNTCLRSVLEDSEVFKYYCLLDKTLEWLDELRDNLRLSRRTNLKDTPPDDIDLEEVLMNIRAVLARISEESRELGGEYPQIASAINDAFESHWKELFVPEPIVNGKKVAFRRHNNGLESSHRRTRKAIRERTGRSETNSEMEQFGDLLAILSNLWNPTYQKEILRDVVDLSYSLSPFVNDLPILRKEYRKTRKGPEIPIADEKRMGILEDFIQALETTGSSNELVYTLQSILGIEGDMEAVCLC